MKAIGIIPARYGSTRLEGKPLKDICGKPMIRLVYEAAQQAQLLQEVYVATDDERIVRAVEQFGGNVRLTSPDHKTGTDRIAEVARDIETQIVVNIQGDEPLLNPAMIDEVIQPWDARVPLADPPSRLCMVERMQDGISVERRVIPPGANKAVHCLSFALEELVPGRAWIPDLEVGAQANLGEHLRQGLGKLAVERC